MNKITVKKLKTFPSMEWGEDGGFCCDIYYDGVKQGYFHQAGEGGCYSYNYYPGNTISERELNEYCKKFFNKNEFARGILEYSLEDVERFVDLETMVLLFFELKDYKKLFKKLEDSTYKSICICLNHTIMKDINNTIGSSKMEFRTYCEIPENLIIDECVKKRKWNKNDNIKVYQFSSINAFKKTLFKME